MEIKEKVSLSKYCTFGIGGVAEYFCVAQTKEDLLAALEFANKKDIPWRILGGGSNVLIPDIGVAGLVIKNALNKLEYKENCIVVESGASLAFIVANTIKNGRGGLEFAAGIPGSIGGAIVGNAGAYGESIGDYLISATVYCDGGFIEWDKNDFDFRYRYSKLKSVDGIIIVSAKIRLNNSLDEKCFEKILADNKRRSGSYFGRNVGSYFKNIPVESLGKAELLRLKDFIINDKVVAAKLIESLGLKGFRVGGVEISPVHGNVINNVLSGTAEDVINLEKIVIDKVYDKYRVKLVPEIVKY